MPPTFTPAAFALAAAAWLLAPTPARACDTDPVDIFFAAGSAHLTAAEREAISYQAMIVQSLGEAARIRLTAHTDRVGDGRANLDLSERRAEAITQVLGRYGVPRSQIDIVSRGEAVPPVPTVDGRPEPKNRVVNVAALAASQVRREHPVPGCHGLTAP